MKTHELTEKVRELISEAKWTVTVRAIDGRHIVAQNVTAAAAKKTIKDQLGRAPTWDGKSFDQWVDDDGRSISVEKGTPKRRGTKLFSYWGWDDVIEAGVFEEMLAPVYGFELDDLRMVKSEDRSEWGQVHGKVIRWLEGELRTIGVEAYGADNAIRKPDLERLAALAKMSADTDIKKLAKPLRRMAQGKLR